MQSSTTPSIQDFLGSAPSATNPSINSATAPIAPPAANNFDHTPSKKRRRFPWLKIAGAGLFVFLLAIGGVAAVLLTQQSQESRSRASIGQYPEIVISQSSATSPGDYDLVFDGTTMPAGTSISSFKIELTVFPGPDSGDIGQIQPAEDIDPNTGNIGQLNPNDPTTNMPYVTSEADSSGDVQGVTTTTNKYYYVQPNDPDFPTIGGRISPVNDSTQDILIPEDIVYCDTKEFQNCPAGQECFTPPVPKCEEGQVCMINPRPYCQPKINPTPKVTPAPSTPPARQQICDPRNPTCPSGFTCVANTSPGYKQCDDKGVCVYGDPAPGYCVAKPGVPSPTPAQPETLIYSSKQGIQIYMPNNLAGLLSFSSTDAQLNADGSIKISLNAQVSRQAASDTKEFSSKLNLARVEISNFAGNYGGGQPRLAAKVTSQSILGYRPGSAVITELYEPNLPKPTIAPTIKPTTQPTSQPTPQTITPCGPDGSCPAGYSCITPPAPHSNCVPSNTVSCPQVMPPMPRCVPTNDTPKAYEDGNCWSKVVTKMEGSVRVYYWPDGCKGKLYSSRIACSAQKIMLNKTEINTYLQWTEDGKPALAACDKTILPTSTPAPSPSIYPRPPASPTPTSSNDYYDPNVCWSSAILRGNLRYWPNSCRGKLSSGMVCTPGAQELTLKENQQYGAWYRAGEPEQESCNNFKGTPIPIGSPSIPPMATVRPSVQPTPLVIPSPSPTTTPIWRRIIPWRRPTPQPTAAPAQPKTQNSNSAWYSRFFFWQRR